jgi:hypothetical protein
VLYRSSRPLVDGYDWGGKDIIIQKKRKGTHHERRGLSADGRDSVKQKAVKKTLPFYTPRGRGNIFQSYWSSIFMRSLSPTTSPNSFKTHKTRYNVSSGLTQVG